MRFSIVILPEYPWEQAVGIWQRAEQLGFAQAWTYDHLAWRTLADGPWHAAVPTLTAAALATSTMRIGTLVASPNFRHPVPFAKELVTVDDISKGRLTLGLGAGGIGFDATVLGEEVLPARNRADRFTEFVRLLDQLLLDDHTSTAGQYYTSIDARTVPSPIQRPRIPFVVAANGPRMMKLATQFGAGWVTTGSPDPDGGLAGWWSNIAELSQRFDDVVEAADKDRGEVARHLSVDASGVPALSSIDYFGECVGRASDLGFSDLIIHWPRQSGVYAASRDVLEEVAARYLCT
ncbi:MAG TPA: LLM class flavin-dependent oxidoreductase [Actinobacteria bacterium]|jgi:alkanesulfonate monooxygenase SsuD/methylene tetrahydromethanopterin reductase-like flavin-dependent oxidoreductase (luciferase family)|nr:LLM class flavin-dependent oxidoreductase [Actinomycetota bacterium]